MEVALGTDRRRCVEAPTLVAVRVRAEGSGREQRARHPRLARPTTVAAARDVLDRDRCAHDVAHALELQHQVVSVRPDLDLEVVVPVRAQQEELEHLVLPELPHAADGDGRRRVPAERSVDEHDEIVAIEPRVEVGDLGLVDRGAVPGIRDGDAHARAITAIVVVVQKYGGSSLKDVDGIQNVADRVVATVRQGQQVCVVVSAMGNTTNELLALARKVSPNPPRRELDLLVSVGERVSMTLLAMAIADRGVEAQSFTGSQSGIVTDEEHVRARVIEIRPDRIQKALAANRVAIVAGFQGMSRAREVTTLGRGGSDTTAVVLAAALGAEWCEICSDVDGVYTADPRVVPEAGKHDTLSLDAALSLARGGAKVLLADALAYAKERGVALRAAATKDPSGTGTLLVPGPVTEPFAGIAARTHAELLLADRAAAKSLSVPVAFAWPSGAELALVVPLDNLPERASLVLPRGARSEGAIATVTVVGLSVAEPRGIATAVEVAEPFGLRGWAADGASWTGAVRRELADDLVRTLHSALETGG
jgi:aspartate kinase